MRCSCAGERERERCDGAVLRCAEAAAPLSRFSSARSLARSSTESAAISDLSPVRGLACGTDAWSGAAALCGAGAAGLALPLLASVSFGSKWRDTNAREAELSAALSGLGRSDGIAAVSRLQRSEQRRISRADADRCAVTERCAADLSRPSDSEREVGALRRVASGSARLLRAAASTEATRAPTRCGEGATACVACCCPSDRLPRRALHSRLWLSSSAAVQIVEFVLSFRS